MSLLASASATYLGLGEAVHGCDWRCPMRRLPHQKQVSVPDLIQEIVQVKWFDQWLIVQPRVGLRSGRLLKGMKTPTSSRAKWFYQHR